MRRSIVTLACACAAVWPSTSSAQGAPRRAPSSSIAPGLNAITESDLRRDIYAMSGDAMRGREAGTLDEVRASGWLAERAREAGARPAGDDGTFFQWWPLRRTRPSPSSQVTVAGHSLKMWQDVVTSNAASVDIDLPIVFVADSVELTKTDVHGKAVAMVLPAMTTQPEADFTLSGNFQVGVAGAVRRSSTAIARAGGAAAILISDGSPNIDAGFTATAAVTSRGQYGVDSAGGAQRRPAAGGRAAGAGAGATAGRAGGRGGAGLGVPTVWLRHDMLEAVRGQGARLTARTFTETFYYPSANVIAMVKGTDPALAHEYVLFSSHQDHDGTRYSVNGDSIWNGADDNASVSVALLAAIRAFAQHPAKRPILFVWHGAEDRGLLGSKWLTGHPVIPLSQIVAVINGDMIGRNTPDSAALLGVQPPHKNSNALVAAALQANAAVTHFKLDTIWDRPTHREGWYFRSDHLPYAQSGVPAIMFSTLLHPDYHTPRDGPERIDIPKLRKMAQWMYATGWIVANAAQRPDVIPGFQLER